MEHKQIISRIVPKYEIKNGIYSFINPFSYLQLLKTPNIDNVDGFFIDGSFFRLTYSLFYNKSNVYSFDNSSLAPKIFNRVSNNNKTIYIIGEKKEVLTKFIDNLNSNYPNINIVGFSSGFYNKVHEINIFKQIIELSPDYCIVGLGTPKQELFLSRLKSNGFKGIAFSCGGFIKQSSVNFAYYPKSIQKLNLRWLYRFIKEPHTRKRYLIHYPYFIVVFLLNSIKNP